MERKITKEMKFEAIKAMVADAASVDIDGTTITVEDVVAFVDESIEQLQARAAKAKERAAERRAEADELREAVKAVLTDEFQTRDDIFAKVEGEDLTINKVGARLTQLVASGDAVKEPIKVGDRRLTGYKLA